MRRRRARSRGLTLALLAGGGVAAVGVALALLAAPAWISPAPLNGEAPAAPPSVTGRNGLRDGVAVREGAPTPAAPPLTFYRDLTAPLPRPPKSAERPEGPAEAPRPEARRGEGRPSRARLEDQATLPPRSRGPEPAAPSVVAGAPPQFTVQVAAFLVPASAEALRDRLSAAGFDAYVVRAEGAEGVRYRVRVGAFTSREAARELADRLHAERGQPTYVTTR